MSDLFGNHIVGFSTRRLICIQHATNSKKFSIMMEEQIFMSVLQYIFLDQDRYQRKWRVWFLRRWFTIQTLNIEFKGKADIILNTLILFIESCIQGPSHQNKYHHCMFLISLCSFYFLNCMFYVIVFHSHTVV